MSWFRRLHPLELTAGTTSLALILAAIGLSVYSNWLGVHVSLYTADPHDQISPYETISLHFSQPVQAQEAQKELKLVPTVPGKFEWQNDHTLLFIPSSPYPKSLAVHLRSGPIGAGGSWLRWDLTWALNVRQPQIVYLSSVDPSHELMVVSAGGGKPRRLTDTGGTVFDFDTSPVGDGIVYSALNQQKGLDLWLVDRDGKNVRRLLSCRVDRCFSPAWSPDGRLIAYNRQTINPNPAAPQGTVRLRIVDSTTGQDQPVFANSQTIGSGALWSPDGSWLASDDPVAEQIRVVNLKTGQQVLLPSSLGLLGSWSPDSLDLVYPDALDHSDSATRTVIYRADFKSGEAGVFVGNSAEDVTDYLDAAWCPSADQVVLNIRLDPQHPDQELWLYHPATLDGLLIAHQSGYTYDFPRWDPWGTRVVFQEADLNTSYSPQVTLWQEGQPLKIIAQDGLFPQWLP
jgi:dipeptidyl aminopeptidase/acylaminoacyl peptidase